MNIYLSTETNFDRNGLGFLTDCLSAYHSESLNGDMTLEAEFPINAKLIENLVENNIIKANIGNDNYQLFKIKRVTKTFDTIKVYALHITYDLLNNIVLDSYPQNLPCQNFGQWVLSATNFNHNFTFNSDITTTASARYIRKNPIEIIMGTDDNSMLNLFGGEIVRDNFTIKLLSRRGSNNHHKLIIGKNITSIQVTTDDTGTFTRLLPLGYNGLTLPEKFVDSPLINDYPTPRIAKVEFSDIILDETGETEGAYTRPEDAYAALRNACVQLFNDGIDRPVVNAKINWLELSKTEQYKTKYQYLERVQLGDTITAEILGLDYTTKVTRIVYNVLTDNIDTFEIGTMQNSITSTLNNQNTQIQEINPTSILEEARKNASGLINSAMGGYVYKTESELFIMDTDNPATAQKVWRWNINGLGYSSNGINGTYSTAMTMDGSIVGDMITTGTIKAERIEGLESLNISVESSFGDVANQINDLSGNLNSSISQLTLNESSIQASVTEILKDLSDNTEKIKNMSSEFTTNGLRISSSQSDFNALFNNVGVQVFDRDKLTAIFNQNGSGVNKLIIVESMQFQNLLGYKRELNTRANGTIPVISFFWNNNLIETLEDLRGGN